MSDDPDILETVATAATTFEAQTIVAVLHESGIDAVAFDAAPGVMGLSLTGGINAVPVQVRRGDLERARAALKQNVADSVDLDWNEVDVGEREDALPLGSVGRRPLLAHAGWWLAVILLGSVLFGFLRSLAGLLF
jgi:hypothetical protein